MKPPEHYIKPEDVHPTHRVVEEGWTISDPVCEKCRCGVHDDPEMLSIPCEGKQLHLFADTKEGRRAFL